MTDILSRLAALNSINEHGLLPCERCGSALKVRTNSRKYNRVDYVLCGHYGPAKLTLSEAIDAWNSRPREAALIALVQEAAGEIERLRAALKFYCDADYDGTGFWDGISLPAVLADKGTTANEALNPPEVTS